MWVIERNGKEEQREDIEHCIRSFPLFRIDFPILFKSGIIKCIAFDHYEWTKSVTSLAEYFIWIGEKVSYVPGGFWEPTAKAFRVNKRTLSKSASRIINANSTKQKNESNCFKKIRIIVEQYRKQIEQQREKYITIKTLIDELENEEIEIIKTEKIGVVLEKIKTILD